MLCKCTLDFAAADDHAVQMHPIFLLSHTHIDADNVVLPDICVCILLLKTALCIPAPAHELDELTHMPPQLPMLTLLCYQSTQRDSQGPAAM